MREVLTAFEITSSIDAFPCAGTTAGDPTGYPSGTHVFARVTVNPVPLWLAKRLAWADGRAVLSTRSITDNIRMRADDGTCTEEETKNREDTEDMHTA